MADNGQQHGAVVQVGEAALTGWRGSVGRADAATVDAAVRAAHRAAADWGRTPPKDRAAVLHRIADGVEARIDDLSVVETRDNGSLLRSHRRSVMPRVARNFRFFADKL